MKLTIGVYFLCTQPNVRKELWNPCIKWNESVPIANT